MLAMGPPSSAKSIDVLEFITNSQGDISSVGSQLEPTLDMLDIPFGMWARLPLSFAELASNRGVM